MAKQALWLSTDSMNRLSSMSGNIDIDKIAPFIYIQQRTKIRTLLGMDLYNKINNGIEEDDLSGEYLFLYENFIEDMIVYYTASSYIRVGTPSVTNSGIHKLTPENTETIDSLETIKIAENWDGYGNAVKVQLLEYLNSSNIKEWKSSGCNSSGSFGLPWALDGGVSNSSTTYSSTNSGGSDADLPQTKEEFNAQLIDGDFLFVGDAPTIGALNLKVDKISGKGLSTEDFTTSEKTKLNNILGVNTGDETTNSIQTKRPLKTVNSKSIEGNGNVVIDKTDLGLSNVNNTSDLNKPISNAGQVALDAKEPIFSKNTAFNKGFGNTVNTVVEGNDTRVVEAFKKKVNAIAVTGDSNKTITITREDGTVLTASFLDKDTEYPDDVINTLTFNANNDGVLIAITSLGEVLSISLDGRYSLLGHIHNISDITGLQDLIDSKQDVLVSGESVKTVAGKSVLGSGDLSINKSDVGLSNVDNTSDVNKPLSNASVTALGIKVDKESGKGLSSEDYTSPEKTKLSAISGSNTGDETTATIKTKRPLKTINGQKLDGSGDIKIAGGGGGGGGITNTAPINAIPMTSDAAGNMVTSKLTQDSKGVISSKVAVVSPIGAFDKIKSSEDGLYVESFKNNAVLDIYSSNFVGVQIFSDSGTGLDISSGDAGLKVSSRNLYGRAISIEEGTGGDLRTGLFIKGGNANNYQGIYIVNSSNANGLVINSEASSTGLPVKITLENVLVSQITPKGLVQGTSLRTTAVAPTQGVTVGVAGEIIATTGYIYVCAGGKVWARAALTTY